MRKAQIALEAMITLALFLAVIGMLLSVYVDALEKIEHKNLEGAVKKLERNSYNEVFMSIGEGRNCTVNWNQKPLFHRWFT